MNDQEKILTSILQNAEMGETAIKRIFPAVHDSALKTELRHQLAEYAGQRGTVNRQMSDLHLKGKPISPMQRLMGSLSIKLKSAADSSTSHLAEMLIQGTNMGIININKALNSADTAPDNLTRQAKELLDKEQHYLDRLKAYL